MINEDTIYYHELAEEMHKLGEKINLLEKYYPTIQFGDPYDSVIIEIVSDAYCYIVMERGRVIKRKYFRKLDSLMFYVFSEITDILSSHYAADLRLKGQDYRQERYNYQIELMNKIKPEFGEKCKKEIDKIIEKNSYNDSP